MPTRVCINETDLDRLNGLVEELHNEKSYRPVAVVLVENTRRQVLLVQSAKNSDWWGLPQGGIEQGECLIDAAIRELEEETGITSESVEYILDCGTNYIDIPKWEHRDGFQKGKWYFYLHFGGCKPEVNIKLKSDELSAYKWLHPSEAVEQLSTVNEEKRDSIIKAMQNVYLIRR
jgi:putative (di)nucleoside polyphosphate hydrolase